MRVLAVIAALYLAACAANEPKMICYYGSWSVYRPSTGKFTIEHIDPKMCSHLIYTFVGLQDKSEIKILDPWQDTPNDYGKDGFGRFNKLKSQNPALKTLIAIGGWNEGSTKYSQMASDPSSRERFADNVVAFVKKWGFDGFDLDWEYPAQRGGSPSDVKNFVELVKVMSEKLHSNGLLLTAAVAAAGPSASQSYDVAGISKYLDFINLMTYDLHGAWESVTGHNAPLDNSKNDPADAKSLTVKAAVKWWLSQGAPKEKLILGTPTYGRAFTLSNPSNNKIGAPASGPGAAGPYTGEPGMLGYNEICEMQKKGDWNVFYDEEIQGPYAYKGNQWVGYDDVRSMKEKAKLIKELGLGGAMVWSIETDDFQGVCGDKFPLIKTLNACLRDGSNIPEVPSTPEEKPSTSHEKPSTSNEKPSTPSGSTGPGNSGEDHSTDNENSAPTVAPTGKCTQEGLLSHPGACTFSECANDGHGGFIEYPKSCGDGLCFDPIAQICDWSENSKFH